MTDIVDIVAREILDSRGNPTVEVDVVLEDGSHAAAPPCPSGASTGAHEAVELRDGDKKRYGGKGVLQGGRRTSTARSSTRCLGHRRRRTSAGIDRRMIELDGTPNKARLGANAILGVSLAVGQGRGGRARPAAVRYLGGVVGARAAGADDEHHQRRRPRRQPDRHPGVHDHARRAPTPSPRPCAWAPRSSTR